MLMHFVTILLAYIQGCLIPQILKYTIIPLFFLLKYLSWIGSGSPNQYF